MAVKEEIDWQARAVEAERRAAEAWDAYHRVAADRAEAAHYKGLLEAHQRSVSWQLTAPLRVAKLIARWLLRRMKRAIRP